jgi:hypothetical protein
LSECSKLFAMCRRQKYLNRFFSSFSSISPALDLGMASEALKLHKAIELALLQAVEDDNVDFLRSVQSKFYFEFGNNFGF